MCFENFIVGDSNRLAYSVALAVIETPGLYNPLVLYGPSGTGKTHLLHAISEKSYAKSPELKIACITAEAFATELIDAIKSGKAAGFREKYRSLDMLLIDNADSFAGKKAMQKELFNVFNCFYEEKKQIVVTLNGNSDRALGNLEQCLAARFHSGLSVGIDPPDYGTRLAIIKASAEKHDLKLSDEICAYIAMIVPGDSWQINSAVKSIKAHIDVFGLPDINLLTK